MRPDEVRRMALRDFVPHGRERRGHIRIRGSKRPKPGLTASSRATMTPSRRSTATCASERPAWAGDGPKDLAGEEPQPDPATTARAVRRARLPRTSSRTSPPRTCATSSRG